MRIARVKSAYGTDFAASNSEGEWVLLSSVGLDYADTSALIQEAELIGAQLDHPDARTVIPAERDFLSPVVRPGKILAVGLNYASHAAETGAIPPEKPLVFAKYPSSLTSPFGEVRIGPTVTAEPDYEVELAVIIGRAAKSVPADQAMDHVFGYAVANDVSSRDLQRTDGQFSRSKSADTFCPIGPWITTADEVPDAGALQLQSTVNGETRQTGRAADMIFDIPQLISHLSATMTLEPGDVILTGTPPGVGLGFVPPRFLQPGDVVECAISGLGSVRNRFVDAMDG